MAATSRSNMLSATEKEAALRRIRAYHYRGKAAGPELDYWKILNWFVRLASQQTPVDAMAASEWQLLSEEYRALQELPIWETKPPFTQNVVTMDDFEKFRASVQNHLQELADRGQTIFGPFTLRRFVMMRRRQEEKGGKITVHSGEIVEPWKGAALLHRLSTLFDRVGLGVLHCPQCAQIFLQPRRDARFCSRPCQANAYARSKREDARAKKGIDKRASARKRARVKK